MPVTTFNPDANPETTSVDGLVAREGVDQTFSNIRSGAGTTAAPSAGNAQDVVVLAASGTSNQFQTLTRSIFLFDTSALPDGATISTVTFEVYITSKDNGLGNLNFVVVASTPASNTDLVNADYGQLGSTALSGTVAVNSVTTNAYNTFTLNASGIAAISKTGVTKLGLILEDDRSGSFSGAWSSAAATKIVGQFSDGTNKPKLNVTYATASLGSPIFYT